MTTASMDEYFAALDRLQTRGEKITNDAVAIEAGRKKGSIKKSRPAFAPLIAAINLAAIQKRPTVDYKKRLQQARETIQELRHQRDQAYARELSLLSELFELRQRLAKLTNDKVLPIRGGERKNGPS